MVRNGQSCIVLRQMNAFISQPRFGLRFAAMGSLLVVGLIIPGCQGTLGPNTWAARGSVSVPTEASDSDFGTTEAGDACEISEALEGKLPKIEQGTRVSIRNESGELLAETSLGAGRHSRGYSSRNGQVASTIKVGSQDFYLREVWDKCVFRFDFIGLVSEDEEFQIEVAGVPSLTFEAHVLKGGRADIAVWTSGQVKKEGTSVIGPVNIASTHSSY